MKRYVILFSLFNLYTFSVKAQMMSSPFQAANTKVKAVDNALNFDGIDDYVEFSKQVQDDFTIEFWMQTTQFGFKDESGTAIAWYTGKALVDADFINNAFDFGVAVVGDKLAFGTGSTTTASDITIYSTSSVITGNWVHVAVVRTKFDGGMKIYINGILETTGLNTYNATLSLNSGNTIRIGKFASTTATTRFFKGSIDDLRIWNTARTSDEILANYNNEMYGNETGLNTYFNFNQGTANETNTITSVFNEVSASNTGTLYGFALAGITSNFTFGKINGSIFNKNLVLYVDPGKYRSYNRTGSTSLYDLSGKGNNMQLILMGDGSLAYNSIGGVLNSSGDKTISAISTVGNSPVLGAASRTYIIWVYPTSSGGLIFSSGAGGATQEGVAIYYDTYNSKGRLYLNTGVGNQELCDIYLNFNQWNFIAITYNNDSRLKFYHNLVSGRSFTKILNSSANKLSLLLAYVYGPMLGNIGTFMVYDKDLTLTELNAIYNATKAKYPVVVP